MATSGAKITALFREKLNMTRNLGRVDQFIRIVFGFALLAYVVFVGTTPDWHIPAITGLYLFLTGSFSYCPFYAALGLTTAKNPDHMT
jgi:Protein of unknown function (DUF2892)